MDEVLREVPRVTSTCKHDVAGRQICQGGKYYAECLICGFYVEI